MVVSLRSFEKSFCNGKLYKTAYYSDTLKLNSEGDIVYDSAYSVMEEGNCVSHYDKSSSGVLDKNFPFFSHKKNKGVEDKIKYYYPSRDLYKLVVDNECDKGVDLSSYNLCPDVNLWVGIGKYDKVDDVELFFVVDDDKHLSDISMYYKLPYPLPANESLNVRPNEWHCRNFNAFTSRLGVDDDFEYRHNFKLGSLKIKNGKPHLLKMYKSNFKDKQYARRN